MITHWLRIIAIHSGTHSTLFSLWFVPLIWSKEKLSYSVDERSRRENSLLNKTKLEVAARLQYVKISFWYLNLIVKKVFRNVTSFSKFINISYTVIIRTSKTILFIQFKNRYCYFPIIYSLLIYFQEYKNIQTYIIWLNDQHLSKSSII